MALSKSLKRKVVSENRAYKEEWKDNNAFILPSFVNAMPVCLICNEVVAVFKEYKATKDNRTHYNDTGYTGWGATPDIPDSKRIPSYISDIVQVLRNGRFVAFSIDSF